MDLKNELGNMVEAGVIDAPTAARIESYLASRRPSSQTTFTVFGILGGLIVGLGVILLIAHNWDDFSRGVRTAFAFLPLFIGQGLAAFAFFKRSGDAAWAEGSALFLSCGIGAVISLVSQVYNIPGDLNSFLSTWMLLILPLAYLMRSSTASIFYIVGITVYGANLGYWSADKIPWQYWLLLGAIVPYYIQILRTRPESRLTRIHNWLVPLSVIAMLGSFASDHEVIMFAGYIAFFGIMVHGGHLIANPYAARSFGAIGSLGTIALLLAASFDEIWKDVDQLPASAIWSSEAAVSIALTAIGIYLSAKNRGGFHYAGIAIAAFPVIFLIGCLTPLAYAAVNLLVLYIGLGYIRAGLKTQHLVMLNYGLLAIGALVLCRFFDSDVSFVLRGISFILVGAGFIGTNLYLLKKRRHE